MEKARLEVRLADERVLRFLKEMDKRARSMRPEFLRLASESVLEQLVSDIPGTPDLVTYRDGLRVAEVLGLDPRVESGYAIHVNAKRSKVRKVDGPRTLLYVRPRRRSRRTPDEVKILERYSPWTIDTLPFTPSKRVAVVISRIVNRREVNRVSTLRRGDKSEWGRELRKAGARWADKEKKGIPIPKNLKALPEIAMTALKLEFGLGTEKSKAHWRPAISRLQKVGVRQILRRHPELVRALYDPRFRKWQKWPTRTQDRIRLGEARTFVAFQKRLGIRRVG